MTMKTFWDDEFLCVRNSYLGKRSLAPDRRYLHYIVGIGVDDISYSELRRDKTAKRDLARDVRLLERFFPEETHSVLLFDSYCHCRNIETAIESATNMMKKESIFIFLAYTHGWKSDIVVNGNKAFHKEELARLMRNAGNTLMVLNYCSSEMPDYLLPPRTTVISSTQKGELCDYNSFSRIFSLYLRKSHQKGQSLEETIEKAAILNGISSYSANLNGARQKITLDQHHICVKRRDKLSRQQQVLQNILA